MTDERKLEDPCEFCNQREAKFRVLGHGFCQNKNCILNMCVKVNKLTYENKKELKKGWEYFLGKIDFGSSFIDGEAAQFMNEFGPMVDNLSANQEKDG